MWRRRFAYVAQTPGMIAGTVADNVRLADPQAGDDEVREVLAAAGAPDLELDHPVGDEAEGLSAGERRRVGIARALLRIRRDADVLVLDEPTAGLDADSEATVVESVRASGASAIVVSHRPAVLAAADRVVRIGADA
jgi:ABC-type transport system involved in cytochrome bd biosynthesis fused ATPase/permease subunit